MPNWCQNIVNCSGPSEDVERLVQFVKGEDKHLNCGHTKNGDLVVGQLFSFKKIIPYEGEWDYGWCAQNWGTKWDACEVNSFLYADHVCYKFETAWAPPVPIFYELNKKFPDVYISWFYHEPMMEFAGYIDRDEQKKSENPKTGI